MSTRTVYFSVTEKGQERSMKEKKTGRTSYLACGFKDEIAIVYDEIVYKNEIAFCGVQC